MTHSLHEEKYCPRCQRLFECKPGNILHCQCSATRLSPETVAHIERSYGDCLCIHCLLELEQACTNKPVIFPGAP